MMSLDAMLILCYSGLVADFLLNSKIAQNQQEVDRKY